MGFCTDEEYEEFMRTCPQLERALIRSGIVLIKYWLSIDDKEQERRIQARMKSPKTRWKLSPMDVQARAHWVDYSEAKDQMFAFTDTKESPWLVVDATNKRSARLNVIAHLMGMIPYESIPKSKIKLPPRQKRAYVRPPMSEQTMVPTRYRVL